MFYLVKIALHGIGFSVETFSIEFDVKVEVVVVGVVVVVDVIFSASSNFISDCEPCTRTQFCFF